MQKSNAVYDAMVLGRGRGVPVTSIEYKMGAAPADDLTHPWGCAHLFTGLTFPHSICSSFIAWVRRDQVIQQFLDIPRS